MTNLKNDPAFERLRLSCASSLLMHDETLIQFVFHHKNPVLRAPLNELIEELRFFGEADRTWILLALEILRHQTPLRFHDVISRFSYDDWVRFLRVFTRLSESEGDVCQPGRDEYL